MFLHAKPVVLPTDFAVAAAVGMYLRDGEREQPIIDALGIQ